MVNVSLLIVQYPLPQSQWSHNGRQETLIVASGTLIRPYYRSMSLQFGCLRFDL